VGPRLVAGAAEEEVARPSTRQAGAGAGVGLHLEGGEVEEVGGGEGLLRLCQGEGEGRGAHHQEGGEGGEGRRWALVFAQFREQKLPLQERHQPGG
jgi:hypothetical protein